MHRSLSVLLVLTTAFAQSSYHQLKKISIGGALRENSARTLDGPQQGFHLSADFLNVLQISPGDF